MAGKSSSTDIPAPHKTIEGTAGVTADNITPVDADIFGQLGGVFQVLARCASNSGNMAR